MAVAATASPAGAVPRSGPLADAQVPASIAACNQRVPDQSPLVENLLVNQSDSQLVSTCRASTRKPGSTENDDGNCCGGVEPLM